MSVQDRKKKIRDAFNSGRFRWDDNDVALQFIVPPSDYSAGTKSPVIALLLDNTAIIGDYISGRRLRQHIFLLHGELPFSSKWGAEVNDLVIAFEVFLHDIMDYLMEYRADDKSDLGILSYEPVGNGQNEERNIYSYTISFTVRVS